MKTFIRVVELWLPSEDGSLLECHGGLYGSAHRFGAGSRGLCFGRGEGLPGQVWEQGRPIVIGRFEGSVFRRTRQAKADGLTCGIALPFFADDAIRAAVLIFCGDDEAHAGAIELWHNDPAESKDLNLDDGYYGTTGDTFEFISRRTSFRKGTGLPGMAWEAGEPVFLPDLGKGSGFLRADSAVKVGINRGFAFPCANRGPDVFVLAFLSALATPIVRRFEAWLPEGDGLWRSEGFCEREGLLTGAETVTTGADLGPLARCWQLGVPHVDENAAALPGPLGAAARTACADGVALLPVLQDSTVVALVAWYL